MDGLVYKMLVLGLKMVSVSVKGRRARQRTPTCNKRSRHGGTFPTQGDAILRNVKPVIPSVLVSLPRYIIKCSGGKDGLVCWGEYVGKERSTLKRSFLPTLSPLTH